eukprot:85145_1
MASEASNETKARLSRIDKDKLLIYGYIRKNTNVSCTITEDGVKNVIVSFYYDPCKELQAVVGNTFIGRDLIETTFEQRIAGNDLILILFAAFYDPPSKYMALRLKAAYQTWKKNEESVEVIFVNHGDHEAGFKGFFTDSMGDWVAYPFGNDQIKKMYDKFGFRGATPCLYVLNANAELIQKIIVPQ